VTGGKRKREGRGEGRKDELRVYIIFKSYRTIFHRDTGQTDGSRPQQPDNKYYNASTYH